MNPPLAQIFLTLALIIAVARLGGALFERIGQPSVVGEIAAGIALGPSALGLVAPGTSAALVPTAVAPFIQVVSQIGLVVFMMLVGVEVDMSMLSGKVRLVTAVGLSATFVPFGLAVLLALWVRPLYPTGVPAAAFILFFGVALSVTAFPVLARIVRERGLSDTPAGMVALAAAAVIDVLAWGVLSVVTGVVAAGHGAGWLPLSGIAFALVMLLAVRPLLARAARRGLLDRCSDGTVLVAVLSAAALAACFTESIGLHSIFGPFVVGLVVPRSGNIGRMITERLTEAGSRLLLPAFFVVAGMSVRIQTLNGADLAVLSGTLAVAVAGKIGGGAAPARVAGWDNHSAMTLGILLNTRGLTELVVLGVGLTDGILAPRLYTILVLMAIVTTVATGPLLAATERSKLLLRRKEVLP